MKKIAAFLLIVLTVSISGCVIPGTDVDIPFIPNVFGPKVHQEVADVVRIKSLSAIPNTIPSGSTTRLIAYIENLGTETIPQKDFDQSSVTVELYDFCEGFFTFQHMNCPGEAKEESCKIKLLPLQVSEIDWTLKAGDAQVKTICPQDGMKVSVRYPYKTFSTTTITFINKDEMQRQIEQGRFKQTDSDISIGEGPVKVYLKVEDTQPVPVSDKEGEQTTVIALVVENKGKGYVVGDSSLGTGESEVIITDLDLKGLQPKTDCEIQNNKKIKLVQNKRKITCEFVIPDKVKKTPKESTLRLSVGIKYAYEFRKNVKVTVEPKF
ncbi:MAG: hypothetical protein DRP15_00655 [Candidatus Aenigmatarchaeota archaeon]|nr:MAG: hypothetical protein DRP15_00655 [Candidatus Aenigmarchaeota archaeon]